MRILTLNANLRGVGTYGRCFYFSRELARAGHDVTMVTVSKSSKCRPRVYYKRSWLEEHDAPRGTGPWIRMIEGPGLGYKWLPGWGSGPLDILLRTRALALDEYDVVYGFEYQPNVSWPVYLTRLFRRYRFFSDWCDWYAGASNHLGGCAWAHRIDAFFEESIRFVALKITVISDVLLRRASAIGIAPERIIHIRQGVDSEYIRPFSQDQVRRELKIPPKIPVIATVQDGYMSPVIRIVAEVFKLLPSSIAIVLGNVTAAEKHMTELLGVRDRVLFPGYVSDADYPKFLSAADVCLLPLPDVLLNRARFPGKLLDFLAAGKPVITNDVGEAGALIRERGVGMVTGQDEEELATATLALLRDAEHRRWLGEQARRVIVQDWDWQLRGSEIQRVVESVA